MTSPNKAVWTVTKTSPPWWVRLFRVLAGRPSTTTEVTFRTEFDELRHREDELRFELARVRYERLERRLEMRCKTPSSSSAAP